MALVGTTAHPYLQIRRNILLVLLSLLAIVYVGVEFYRPGDFLIYYQASKDLFLGKDIYSQFYGESNVFPYLSSPFLAFLLGPLTLLPFPFAAALWKLINLFFLYRIWTLIESYFEVDKLSKKEYKWFVWLSFLSVSYVIYRNFALNQFTVFLLFTVLEGVHWIFKEKKDFLGALIIAVGITAKLMPLVALPYLVYRGKWKASVSILVFVVLLSFLPTLAVGIESCCALLQAWGKTVNPNNDLNAYDVMTNDVHGLPALVSTLLIKEIGFNEYTLTLHRHLLDLDPKLVLVIIQVVRLMFVGFTLFFLRTWPFKDAKNEKWQYWEIGYLLLVTPLVFPQQRQYAFFFFFPALTYLAYYVLRLNQLRIQNGEKIPVRFYVYAVALVVFNLELIFGNYREHYWHFKTLTYSALTLLVLYAITPPSLLEKKAE